MFFEILLEGGADVPTIRNILENRFALIEGEDFRIHPHRGKGSLPENPLQRPEINHRGLLDQLPAKLRGYGRSLDRNYCVVVIVDADDDDCKELKQKLVALYDSLPTKPPVVLFRIAVEETESWFLADPEAIRHAFPSAKIYKIQGIEPDQVVGAWERLAECLGKRPEDCDGRDKLEWGIKISPHLLLQPPASPSLAALLNGIDKILNGEDQ
jgi:hypothetical protein